ncbi:MAG: hypothetical protein U9Q75_10100, partial [Pseudomonadota bacterium]|nr:hypothetical protein [Pseudomonadota bacterium]
AMPKLFHVIFPGLLAITLGATAGADNAAPASIEEALEERGWSVHRTFAGDLYLFAPAEESTTAESSQESVTPSATDAATESIDLQTLGNKLEASGWKVDRKSDGSLKLHPRETVDVPAQEEKPAPSPADEQWDQMQQQLNAAGWDATRESDGSLVLIPPDEEPQTAAPVEEKATAEQQADSMQTMQEKLTESGWQVMENSDGSIIFYPPKQQHSDETTIQPAHGYAPPADFSLPVTSWSQTLSLTQNWLKQQSGEYSVGKIREIYEIYLVSIITSSKPHRLKHQIAIRKSDGHIIVLE